MSKNFMDRRSYPFAECLVSNQRTLTVHSF
jgi:hypothetical protein